MPGIATTNTAIPFEDFTVLTADTVPANALLVDDSDTPLLDDDGSYILVSD